MLYFLNDMRLSMVEFLKKMNPVTGIVDVDFLMKTLKFENEEDTIGFMISCGFTNIQKDLVYLRERMLTQDWVEKNKIWR